MASDNREQNPVLSRLRVAILYNPRAGSFSPTRLGRLCDAFVAQGCQVSCHDSSIVTAPGDLPSADFLCISGGDGTIRQLVTSLGDAAYQARFCIHPCGTINLIAREAGYRVDPGAFVADLVDREIDRRHHVGRIGAQSFLCCASVGADAQVVASVSARLKARIGRLAYLVAFARHLFRWKRSRFDLVIDGAPFQAEAVFVLKGRYYAGPWNLDRAADLRADRFRLLLLARAGRRDYLRLILTALFGSAFADSRWIRLSARTVEINGPSGCFIQADGDIVGQTPARLTIGEKPLRFR